MDRLERDKLDKWTEKELRKKIRHEQYLIQVHEKKLEDLCEKLNQLLEFNQLQREFDESR